MLLLNVANYLSQDVAAAAARTTDSATMAQMLLHTQSGSVMTSRARSAPQSKPS
jgi:hypothetical protein